MNLFARIGFPVAVTVFAAAGVVSPGNRGPVQEYRVEILRQAQDDISPTQDTVVYPVAGYKLRRTLELEEITVLLTILIWKW